MEEEYLKGAKNWFIRMFFYLKTGNSVVSEFRYTILAIMGLYAILKLANPVWLIGITVLSTPVLIVIGHFWTHKVGKIIEWLSVKFATHYAIEQFNLQKKQVELLEKLLEKLEK